MRPSALQGRGRGPAGTTSQLAPRLSSLVLRGLAPRPFCALRSCVRVPSVPSPSQRRAALLCFIPIPLSELVRIVSGVLQGRNVRAGGDLGPGCSRAEHSALSL